MSGPAGWSSGPVDNTNGFTYGAKGSFWGHGIQTTFRGATNGGWGWDKFGFKASLYNKSYNPNTENITTDQYIIEWWIKFKNS